MRARQLPFRQFCLELLVNDLKIEVVPPTMHESGSNDDERQGHTSTPSVATITYNKREAYLFSIPHLIERRMN
jgi:hypothetical protein